MTLTIAYFCGNKSSINTKIAKFAQNSRFCFPLSKIWRVRSLLQACRSHRSQGHPIPCTCQWWLSYLIHSSTNKSRGWGHAYCTTLYTLVSTLVLSKADLIFLGNLANQKHLIWGTLITCTKNQQLQQTVGYIYIYTYNYHMFFWGNHSKMHCVICRGKKVLPKWIKDFWVQVSTNPAWTFPSCVWKNCEAVMALSWNHSCWHGTGGR